MYQSVSARSVALRSLSHVLAPAAAILTFAAFAGVAQAQVLTPGNLVVSRSVYSNSEAVHVGDILPPGCTGTQGGCSAGTGAIAGSIYPYVFNNDTYDASFGITSMILLDQIKPNGTLLNTIEVPNSTQSGVTRTSNQLVTSFSSKSELALHLSTDGQYLSFMGYVAPVAAVDVSNANTYYAQDRTNPDGQVFYRAVATVNAAGKFSYTITNAYSGNNGRAAILNSGINAFYTVGNAGNGANPQPGGVVVGAGAQLIPRSSASEYGQGNVLPTPVGSFSVTELGDKADKIGKDDNFRGIAIFNNVVYLSKGSGSNGVNTVYFIDTTGTACPSGVGLPVSGAALPTTSLPYDIHTVATVGLPSNMCILKGFPTTLAKKANPLAYPQGLFFANATTLYVADEGDGYVGGADLYTHAAAQTTAGLQKWIFDSGTQTWNLAYTLQNGLNLGQPYSISGYPTGTNSVTGLPWAPATDGLRNITGIVGDGTIAPVGKVLIYAVSSTVSGNGDVGADPNRLYFITDDLANTTAAGASKETFYTARYAASREVLRGVSFTPGTAGITSY
jgi:hypothetical protein